jgi:hypothetical protein
MRLKNYNEDLVLDTVKIVLKDRPDVKATKSFMLDVAAFTLNRIPPKYITSERGFTRELIQNAVDRDGQGLIDVIELITLINHAVDVVSGRRKEQITKRASSRSTSESGAGDTFFYNLPHIFGRIVDPRDKKPVFAADITLFINKRLSVPADPGWQNPYHTNEQTKGYFSFWPKPEEGTEEALKVDLELSFNHTSYVPFTFKKSLKIPGEFFIHDYIRADKLLDLGTLAFKSA